MTRILPEHYSLHRINTQIEKEAMFLRCKVFHRNSDPYSQSSGHIPENILLLRTISKQPIQNCKGNWRILRLGMPVHLTEMLPSFVRRIPVCRREASECLNRSCQKLIKLSWPHPAPIIDK